MLHLLADAWTGAHGDLPQLLVRAGTSAAVCGLVHQSLRPVVRRLEAIEPKLRGDWVNRIISSLHAAVVGPFGVWTMLVASPCGDSSAALMRLQQNVDTVNGDVPQVRILLPITMGYFFYDCFMLALDPQVYSPLFVVHHALSMFIWPMSYLNRRGLYYVVYCFATEWSTPVLNLVAFYMPKHGMNEGVVYKVLAISLIISFFGCRVLPIPFLLHAMREALPFWQPADSAIFWTWCFAVPLPMILNSFWFYKMMCAAFGMTDEGDVPSVKKES